MVTKSEQISAKGAEEKDIAKERMLTIQEAYREALFEEMSMDSTIFCLGEDIGRYGGVHGQTKGLWEKFGDDRVRDTPISEGAIVGAAIGAAATGMRPVAEIMYTDFICAGGAMEQIVNQLAKIPYVGNGQTKLPVTIMSAMGSRYPIVSNGPHHNQCFEGWFIHVPGLRVVTPSTPYDCKGLMKTILRSDDPTLIFLHRLLYYAKHKLIENLYPSMVSYVPKEEYLIPLGKADVKRNGKDVTIVATMAMVHMALKAAESLEKDGISAEVVDPRTLVPLDKQTIIDSVKKTGRAVVASADAKTGGVAAELLSVIVEGAFDYLDAPVKRVSALDLPISYNHAMEGAVLPSVGQIVVAAKEVVA